MAGRPYRGGIAGLPIRAGLPISGGFVSSLTPVWSSINGVSEATWRSRSERLGSTLSEYSNDLVVGELEVDREYKFVLKFMASVGLNGFAATVTLSGGSMES